MSKNFFIHLGLPKTGTTSIQFFFNNNADKIRSACNIHWLKTGLIPTQHMYLFSTVDNIWQDLAVEAADNQDKDLLCSSESILRRINLETDLDKMAYYVPSHNPKFIVYLRHFSDLVKSAYSEGAKGRYIILKQWKNLSETLRNTFYYIHNKKDMVYQYMVTNEIDHIANDIQTLKDIIAIYGRDNVTIRPYDKKLLKGGNVVADFLEVVGLDIAELNLNIDVYRYSSLPNESLPLFEELYYYHHHFNDQLKIDIGNKIFQHCTAGKNANIDRCIDWDKVNQIIDEAEELMPGYKALFADLPCSFNFPEIDMEPKERLAFDFLFDLYGQNVDLKNTLPQRLDSLHIQNADFQNTMQQRFDVLWIQNIDLQNMLQRRSLLKHEFKVILRWILRHLPPRWQEPLRCCWRKIFGISDVHYGFENIEQSVRERERESK
jgi:hypothetical protein